MSDDDRIKELGDLGVSPSDAFLPRLRRRIQRREFSSEIVGFSWYLPAAVLLAFLDMVFSIVGSRDSSSGGPS